MVALPRQEQLLQALVTRLEGISTSNTPAGQTEPYQVTVGEVTRFYVELSEILPGTSPTLVVTAGDVEYEDLPGGVIQDAMMSLTVGGILVESNGDTRPENSTLQTDIRTLENEVRRAVYSNTTFGGLAVHTKIVRTEYDEGLAHPWSWFVMNLETIVRANPKNPNSLGS